MVICGAITFVLALVYYRVRKGRLLLHFVVPALISIGLYLLVSSSADREEWALVILTAFFLSGLAGSMIGGVVSWGTRRLISQQIPGD